VAANSAMCLHLVKSCPPSVQMTWSNMIKVAHLQLLLQKRLNPKYVTDETVHFYREQIILNNSALNSSWKLSDL
jgi:hypothetical protein